MPIIRNLNPFRRQDENVRPITASGSLNGLDTATKPIDIQEREPPEYKLCEINDSGVFIPPSPPERKTFWGTNSSRSTTSSNHRSVFNENEPFNISRESFDSYRRSFDISARSPIVQPENRPRASLDSRTFQPLSRGSSSYTRPVQAPLRTQREEPDALEDVSLEDPKPQHAPKKRGVFSRIMDGSSANPTEAQHGEHKPITTDGAVKSSWHHFGGRKRGQSGQGAELGAIPKRDGTSKPDSQLKNEEKAPIAVPALPTETSNDSAATTNPDEYARLKSGAEVTHSPEITTS